MSSTSLHALRFVSVPLYTTLRKNFYSDNDSYGEDGDKRENRVYCGEGLAVFMVVSGALIFGIEDLKGNFSGILVCFACNLATSMYLVSIAHHKQACGVKALDLTLQMSLCALPSFLILSVFTGELFSFIAIGYAKPRCAFGDNSPRRFTQSFHCVQHESQLADIASNLCESERCFTCCTVSHSQ